MTQLSLTHTGRTGYAVKRHSPSVMAAAIAFNGGMVALLLALPSVQKVIQQGGDPFVTRNILAPQDPPPETIHEAKKDPLPFVRQTEQVKQQDDPYIPPTVVETGGGQPFTGSREQPTIIIPETVRVLPPPPAPVFNGATRDPRFADAFTPPYPIALQREGLEGSVTVRVTINEQGRVTACELVKATAKAFFDETREQALKRWRFRPATSDGVPVISQQTLTVHFQLDA